jgi:hypothetical protein
MRGFEYFGRPGFIQRNVRFFTTNPIFKAYPLKWARKAGLEGQSLNSELMFHFIYLIHYSSFDPGFLSLLFASAELALLCGAFILKKRTDLFIKLIGLLFDH